MSATRAHTSNRLLYIDVLKVFAAQAIVLHHLSVYGPIADDMHDWLPGVMDFLFAYGRMAVQVFLVVGGYLSARALSARGGLLSGQPAELLWRRYLRLTLPFMAAVILSVLCATWVSPWLPEFEPVSVSLGSLIAHALLLHGVLGQESLTAGAWYVAIDFQLFAMLLGLLWLARRSALPRMWRMVIGPVAVLSLCLTSLFLFNLDPRFDDLGLYFFGSYGLGAMVHWLGLSRRPGWGLAALMGLGLLALALAWRERIALAMATALVLGLWQRREASSLLGRAWQARAAGLLAQLSQQSYSLFLVHFPICLLVNAWYVQHDDWPQAYAPWTMLLAWLLSNLASRPFYRWIEAPSTRLRLNPWAWWPAQGHLPR
ncbi:MAG: acyltransferase [Burkholderiaceae bacterium]|nr:acyltransferase [Roseateles sp.]MBV8471192.1 acyltransferase [Burkholderiaceae bacterium]